MGVAKVGGDTVVKAKAAQDTVFLFCIVLDAVAQHKKMATKIKCE